MIDAESIARALGGAKSGDGWKAKCPVHRDDTPSLSISDAEGGRVLVHCHGGCPQQAVTDALTQRRLWPNCERPERPIHPERTKAAKQPIIPIPLDAPPMSFRHPRYGRPSRTWPYHLADGRLAGYAARFDFAKADGTPSKDVLPITFCDLGDGRRAWRSKGIPVPRPLYRLPELLSRSDAPVLITEGEKAADAAQRLFPDYVVTTPMHGAKSPTKTDWTPVKGRCVVVCPDNDQPGDDFARGVAELASDAGAKSVGIVDVPAGFGDGWDLGDDPPAGWTVDRLRELLEAAPAWQPEAESTERLAEPRRRKIRVMGGDLADATAGALRVLASERDPLQAVYVRGSLLMRPTRVRERLNASGIRRPSDALILRALDADWLRLRLAQVAGFYVVIRKDVRPVDPPLGVCRSVIAAAPWEELPTLSGIIEAPTILPDGTLIQTPGYDQATGLLFDPGDTSFSAIPNEPTREQAEAGLRTLAAPFKDFPFVDEPSRSVALAAVLSALVRRGLRAAPLTAFDAPKMASGKSLIATVCSYVATGRGPYLMSQVADPTDERKRLLSALLENPAVIVIDNIEHPLRSDSLCIALTEPSFTDRLLGQSRTATVATNCCFFATGNNVIVAGDLSARALVCRIDPACERPEERTFALNLHEWVPAHRGELAAAALTIIKAYLAAGEPRQAVPNFARFEDWQRLCRFPLTWLGCADPCDTRRRIEASDPVRETLRALLAAWHRQFSDAG